MNLSDSATTMEEEAGVRHEQLESAAANFEVNNLFTVLADAELVHHDALVEITGKFGPQKCQFRLLKGAACLLRTSPAKA